MLASISSDSFKGKVEQNQYTMYCCAALTAPTNMTPHMQAGDILVSINGVSLISSSDQAELKGGMDAFFEVITAAIKHAKSPRKVRLLRPMRLKALNSAPKPAAYEISLSELESSLLFDPNFRNHIPKFTVGKMPLGKTFEPVTASLFDVIFPFQQSLGIRIYPYKLVNIHSLPKSLKGTPRKPIPGIRQNNLMDDMLDDGSLDDLNETLNDSYADFYDETKETDNESFESELMVTVNDCLQLLSTSKDMKKNPNKVESMDCINNDRNDPNRGINGDNKTFTGEAPSKLRAIHCHDDDIVSDRGRIAVGIHVSRLEASGDDFIPVSSPLSRQNEIDFIVEDEEIEKQGVSTPSTTKAVGNMVSRFESTSSHSSRRGSYRVSPIRRVIVNLNDVIPHSVDTSPNPMQKTSEPSTSQKTSNGVVSHIVKVPSIENIVSPSYLTVPNEKNKTTRQIVRSISPIRRRVEKTFLELSPTRDFPGLSSADVTPEKMNDSTTQRIVLKAVAKFKSNLSVVTSENQQLKAKMDFYRKSVSIEKQLLNFELKGVKAKLQSSEEELEDTKIESKMNAIILQDELEQNMTGVVSTILGEKEILQDELKKAKDYLLEMEIKFADQLTETLEESDAIRSELEARINENTALTALVLNLQAESDCLKSSAAMTQFRIMKTAKTHAKEISVLKESSVKTKLQVMSFIKDFDTTVLPSSCTETTIEAFLNWRGLAINKKRRKVFKALQEDNNKLHDDLDVLQQLLDVETQLHKTRFELYSKVVTENNDTQSNEGISALNSPGRVPSSCVKLLFNNEIKEEKMAWNTGGKGTVSRPLNKSSSEKKRGSSVSPKENVPRNVISSEKSKSMAEEGSSKPRSFANLKKLTPTVLKVGDVSTYDSTIDSPDGKTSTESSGVGIRIRTDLGELDKENKGLKNIDTGCGGKGSSDQNISPALSSNSSTNSLKSASTSLASPTFLSITPRKKNVVAVPKNEKVNASPKNEFKSPGHKVPVGFGSSTSRNGDSIKGNRRYSDKHQPIDTLSYDNYINDVTVAGNI